MRFDLYLESGPQHKRTWVFVPGLPGTSTVAPTSDDAPAAAVAAIEERLRFLRRHGDDLPAEPIEISIAEHVIERKVLGFGQQFFAPDALPLTADEAARLVRWAEWSREELVAAAHAAPRPLTEKPAAGRSTAAILAHVVGGELAYVGATLGFRGAGPLVRAVEESGEEPWAALEAERAALLPRLRDISADELVRLVESGGRPKWSARRMFRRLLEHGWEHVLELRARA